MTTTTKDFVDIAWELVKEGKLNVDDLEDRLGVLLQDPEEEVVRGLMQEQTAKRFPLRHPYATGIPTLGIAPAVSKGRAEKEIIRRLLRSNPGLAARKKVQDDEDYARAMDEERLAIKRLKAAQPTSAINAAGLNAASLLAAHHAAKRREGAPDGEV